VIRPTYRYSLSITSQFPFCSIPFRLDSYSQCQFACAYCFAAARGGYTGKPRVASADASALMRRLQRLASGPPRSAVDEMLAARVPIHFGGMSDPFMPIERSRRVTLELLRILSAHRYPTIISTKSVLCSEPEYLDVLASGDFAVQFSISTLDARLSSAVDIGASCPAQRLRAMEILSARGIRTSGRLQPLLPGREDDGEAVINAVANAGARHVGVEHLKLSVERSARGTSKLSEVLERDLPRFYKDSQAKRCGREWILPPMERVQRMLRLRGIAWSSGLTFVAADTDLLHLSDGESCCSGADLLGFATAYRFTYTQALHASTNGEVRFASIAKEWRPSRSIGQFVNSKCRLPGSSPDEYVRDGWNGILHGHSPKDFYGVSDTGQKDNEGFVIYQVSDEVRSLMHARAVPNTRQQESGPAAVRASRR
jgi:DNA repair photolyase